MFRVIFLVSLIVAILTACASQRVSPGGKELTGALSAGQEAQEKPREEWQSKWDKIVQEAKREGKVVIKNPLDTRQLAGGRKAARSYPGGASRCPPACSDHVPHLTLDTRICRKKFPICLRWINKA